MAALGLRAASRRAGTWLLLLGCAAALATSLPAAEPAAPSKATNSVAAAVPALVGANAALRFDIRGYVVKCDTSVFTNAPTPALSQYTGSNVSLQQIVQAAASLLLEYQKKGYRKANISIAREFITNGIVTMNVYQGVFPQVLISGRPCFSPGDAGAAAILAVATLTATNATTAVTTNAEPRFNVIAYEIRGDTLLSTNTLMSIFAKRTGTNVALSDITQAASDLQMEYRNRGYPTVKVMIPPQQLTNGMVKIRVFQGRLSEILVTYENQHHYFSSNNVMRALPGLHTNTILVGPVFQAGLDQANANQDRQIYPHLEEGLQENTTALNLVVKDRLPLHAKIEINNQSSPGTPDLRVNTSASYQNLWQLEHSIGLQYSFSPETYKTGPSWNFYDYPLVVNYSAFYRLPLGAPTAVEDVVSGSPGTFGYDEATRKFQLPPPSGRPELNFYASRSTIDTGLQTSDFQVVATTTNLTVTSHNEQQDVTVNQSLGFRLSLPVSQFDGIRSTFSGGFDYKDYQSTVDKSYVYNFIQAIPTGGGLTNYVVTTYKSPVPTVDQLVSYLPLSLRWDGSRPDKYGSTAFGLCLSANTWFSDSVNNLQSISRSSESSGYWFTLTPSMSRDFVIHTNWILSVHGAGQWANQPLISNEQFGLGGVNSVRGYQEGEVFGDTGWWMGLEQKTPAKVVGLVYRNHPLTVRASAYMEYGESYLLDAPARGGRSATPLWGTGFGGVATIGATWEARLLFSWPLLGAGTTAAFSPRLDFSLSAQF